MKKSKLETAALVVITIGATINIIRSIARLITSMSKKTDEILRVPDEDEKGEVPQTGVFEDIEIFGDFNPNDHNEFDLCEGGNYDE